jgi:1-acyl-sn-glycerol-3-phosphate acyltransferase
MRRTGTYRAASGVVRLLVRSFTRPSWSGTAHVPSSGGVVLVANHLSFLDPLVLGAFVDELGRQPRFLAKSELFSVPLFGRVLRATGQIPVQRATVSAVKAYEDAVAAVRRGECVVVYPEGTLTRDPERWPMRGRTGVARIALVTRAPVVPVAQWGVQDVLPPWSRRLRLLPRHDVRVVAGPPVDLSDLYDREPDAELLMLVTERLMAAVTDLLSEVRGESPPDSVLDPRTMARHARTGRSVAPEERQPDPMSTSSPDPSPQDDA